MTLQDTLAVSDTRYRLAAGIDARDWDLARSALADTVHLDYTSHAPDRTPGPVPAQRWIAYLRTLFPGLDASQHSLTNPRVEVAGDTARSTMYVVAEHLLDGDRFTIGGFYDDAYTRTADGWRLHGTRLVVRWTDGDPTVLTRALRRGAALLGADARPVAPGATTAAGAPD